MSVQPSLRVSSSVIELSTVLIKLWYNFKQRSTEKTINVYIETHSGYFFCLFLYIYYMLITHVNKLMMSSSDFEQTEAATANEISVDAAVAEALSELAGIFCINRKTKHSSEGFSRWKRCFPLTADFFFLSAVVPLGSPQAVMSPLAPTGSPELSLTGSTGS